MKPTKFLVALAIAIAIPVFANAQACSPTMVVLTVRDAANADITNARFEVQLQSTKGFVPHETARANSHENRYFVDLGLEVRGTFRIRVIADGFEPKEFNVFFTSGHEQHVAVNLKKSGTNQRDGFQRLAPLTGVVFDVAGRRIANAKVVAVDPAGTRFEMTTEGNGYFQLMLPYNGFIYNAQTDSLDRDAPGGVSKYDLSVSVNGFKPFVMKEIVATATELGGRLDVVLENLGPVK